MDENGMIKVRCKNFPGHGRGGKNRLGFYLTYCKRFYQDCVPIGIYLCNNGYVTIRWTTYLKYKYRFMERK